MPRSGPAPARKRESTTTVEPALDPAHRLPHLPDELGADALPELRAALRDADPWVRAHAVMGLARVDHDDARTALVEALHDESFGVHWAAAKALTAAGTAGVRAALHGLLSGEPAPRLREGAAHVLRYARLTPEERQAVRPVLEAMRHPAADLTAPVAAEAALARLDRLPPAPAPPPRTPWWRTRSVWRRLRGHMVVPPSLPAAEEP
jgi:HEAT repeat protein